VLRTEADPEGLPMSAFDELRAGVGGDRSRFYGAYERQSDADLLAFLAGEPLSGG
jgi:hypothetical protein